MFERFKSAEALELQLREWTFRGYMRTMPAEEEGRWREQAASADIDYLVKSAVAACMNFADQAKLMQTMGSPPRYDELAFHKRGLELVMAFAEKRGWNISWESPVNFLNVKIAKRNG